MTVHLSDEILIHKQREAKTEPTKEITLEITSMCNADCWWCSSDAKPNGTHMLLEKIKEYLNKYKGNAIRISGGEPTLHPDIDVIINYAKECKYSPITLLSNGLIFYRHPFINEYYISILNTTSITTVRLLSFYGENVTMTSVIGSGLEGLASNECLKNNTPLHFYQLQYQGRAMSKKMPISIGGLKCNKQNKITISHDGNIYGCSGEKGEHKCNVCGGSYNENNN